MIAVVLATGPSLTRQQIDSVRERCKAIAVSDAFRLAPWADALASTDFNWWRAHPDALDFAGRKFSTTQEHRRPKGVEMLQAPTSTNSGLLGIMAAVHLGAKRILLLGFDLHSPGQHFFGKHPAPLKSTSHDRMEQFKKQFAGYNPKGISIVNCTPNSALNCYPKANLEDCLAQS